MSSERWREWNGNMARHTLMTCDGKHEVRAFAYTNHRGENGIRVVRPLRLWWGTTEWHPDPQWLLDVWDFQKRATRTYALSEVDGAAGVELLPEVQSSGERITEAD
jgi:hypothetical protein